jgi:hypothetical protein
MRDLKCRVSEIERSFGFPMQQIRIVHKDLLAFQARTEQRFEGVESVSTGMLVVSIGSRKASEACARTCPGSWATSCGPRRVSATASRGDVANEIIALSPMLVGRALSSGWAGIKRLRGAIRRAICTREQDDGDWLDRPSRRAWLDLSLNPAAHGPVGNVEIIARLKVDPEFRRRAEVSTEAQCRVR